MAIDVMAEINSELSKAATPKPSRKPVFLFLSEGQKALIRPMYNLDSAIMMMRHNKWNDNAEYRVNAICAKEIGKTCEHCASDDKDMMLDKTFYVPVYVYQVIDVETGQKLTYKDPDTEEQKPVSGFRLLELTAKGSIAAILKTLNSIYRDEDEHDITVCDFSIEQVGKGKKKSFVTLPKLPKPVNSKIQEACPSIDKFHEAILAARPPLVAGESIETVSATPVIEETSDDDIPVF
jgi:hypothetical protein